MASIAPVACALCTGRASFVGREGNFRKFHCEDCNMDYSKAEPAYDFMFANHGSVCLLTAVSEAARDWRDEHLPTDAQTFGGGIAIEPRYAGTILEGIINDGLTIA